MIISLDIGTTNVKAAAIGNDGAAIAYTERPNRTLHPQPGWSEQEPEEVFLNALSVLREVIAKTAAGNATGEHLQGIVLSSAMHGLVAVDVNGEPLTNVFLWSDLRADLIARSLRQGGEGAGLYRRTGVPLHAMSPLTKLIWLRNEGPDVFRQAHKFLGIKEYVWRRLTGKFAADLSLASATGLMNIRENEWDDAAMLLAGISPERLPVIVSPYHTAYLPEKNATKWGLPAGIPWVIGASDGALANLGSGATGPGEVAVTIGTSAAIRTLTDGPVLDDRMRTFCYRLDEKSCIVGGASNNGTNALEWLRRAVFQSPLDPEQFVNQAFNILPGAEGLLCLPYLSGERAPLYDAQARGSFSGLTTRHGQGHFIRAVMEGVIFNLRIIAEALEADTPVNTLHAGGGFSRNRLWVQILADVFQKPVLLSEDGVDASVLGGVLLARQALGLPEIAKARQSKTLLPGQKISEIYREAYMRFKKLTGLGQFPE